MRASFRRLSAVSIPIAQPMKIFNGGQKDLPAFKESVSLTKDDALRIYKQMQTIRRMETLCDQSYKARKFRGFCHLYIGQEAIAVGMTEIMNTGDQIVTGYRDHGWHICRGGTPFEVFAEMLGKQTGCSKGKGGSMHMYNVKENFFGGNGIVGAQVPIGAGLAFANLYNAGEGGNPKNMAIALYGDGAANQGQVYEAYNMASLWKIPCIFTIENNQFGMGTSKNRASANPNFFDRAEYIPGIKVDGMDVLSVMEATRWCKEWIQAGRGPLVLELDSYRYMGHSMSDPGTSYRSREDIASVRGERDCLAKIKSYIVEYGLGTDEELSKIDKAVKKDIDKQLQEAEKQPNTEMKELGNDVWIGYDHVPIRSCQNGVYLN